MRWPRKRWELFYGLEKNLSEHFHVSYHWTFRAADKKKMFMANCTLAQAILFGVPKEYHPVYFVRELS